MESKTVKLLEAEDRMGLPGARGGGRGEGGVMVKGKKIQLCKIERI